MKIGKYDVHLHSIAVHFTNALYPVAVLFLILSFFYQKDASLLTYFHLMILATFSVPISYITGIIEWKLKYKGAKVRIFARKQRFSLVLLGLGITCTLWYGWHPDVLENVGGLRMVFLFLHFAILPNVIYLGYLGGKLVFGGTH
jgi:uncharacterized membrane protein